MSVCDEIKTLLPDAPARDAMQMSPLTLAYIGDTVYDLYVRTLLLFESDATVHKLHTLASRKVRAGAQAEVSGRLLPLLNEQEASVYRRGRNAHIGTIPKSASIGEYRAATGLEAVFGYLYVKGDDARIRELMRSALLPQEESGGE
ncbi:MAG TPA: ribonuclease III domain-containing protein [Feifaniaceae bacterium]|nr:ribonuclease III domain-containing protein [Feifaniaceae bacterium]